MKKYNKQTFFSTIFGLLLLSLPMASCRKFVELDSQTLLGAEHIFDTDDSANGALNGAYIAFANNINSAFIIPGYLADEQFTTLTSSLEVAALTNTYTPDNNYGFFDRYYACIYQANYLLEGIDNAPNLTALTKTRIKAESLFLRAFSHFLLINYYGAVPYVTTTDAKIAPYLPNNPIADSYEKMIADLKTASDLLTNTYPVPDKSRANKQVVNALLAKVYLYTKDWADAEKAATDVIDSKLYTIVTDLNSVFLSTSTETLFQLYNSNGYALAPVTVPSNPALTTPFTYSVRPELAAAYSATDKRKGTWIAPSTATSGPNVGIYYFNKYKIKATGTVKEYPIIFRLAEMYLIRAEARAQLNTSVATTTGATDLEVTRARAGLTTPLVIKTSADLITAVADERRKELALEMGNRWFDLNRTGQTVTVLKPMKPTIDAHYTVLPYPRNYLIYNRNLVQNPNYN